MSPDRLGAGAAYQASLLAALGDDDPADVQAATSAALAGLVRDAGDDVRTRPDPGEWSVVECLGHIADGELVVSTRYRWILAADAPALAGYDQDDWVRALAHGDDDPAALLDLFGALRRANLALWAGFGAVAGDRIGMHGERGPESYDLTFRLAAGHDRVHLAQARAALARVRASRGGAPER